MNGKINLGILFGGRSGEHDVSLMSARSIFAVLDHDKYNVIPIGITQEGMWVMADSAETLLQALWDRKTGALTRVTLLPEYGSSTIYALQNQPGERIEFSPVAQLDVIFPVLHGTFGEDGTMQGLFELADLAYVGANVLGSAVGMDKALFKDVMRTNGVPVLDSILVTREAIQRDPQGVIQQAESLADYPLFTKPANLGSSVGITKCRTRSDLYEGLMEAASYDRRVLVERGITGAREIEVSVLGNDRPQVSVPGEIKPSGDFYTYTAKYEDERSELIIPAPLSEADTQRIRELAAAAYQAIDGSGMARADFLVDPRSGEIFLSEVNTIPGFTQISMYPKLWEASGLPYAELIDRLIELALERKSDRERTMRQYRRKE